MKSYRAEFVPVLPRELMIEILSWLPVKTLIRFMCVCKSWKSLISDDKAFEKLHLKRSPKNKHVLLALQKKVSSNTWVVAACPMRLLLEEPLSMINEDRYCSLNKKYSMVGSCNGLVCLGSFRDIDVGTVDKFRVWFWNPAIHLRSKKSPTISIGMSTRFGFGYDDLRDTYKVVVLSFSNSCGERKAETMVYCTDDSRWRKALSEPGIPLSLMRSEGQFVSGSVNWLAEDPNHLNEHMHDGEDEDDGDDWDEDMRKMLIVSFDIREETYKFLSLPDTGIVPYGGTDLGVLGNCLCLSQKHEETEHFTVWQMREYGVRESWTRLLSVSYEHLQCQNYTSPPTICLGEDGDIVILIPDFKAIRYNLRDNSVKHVEHPDNKLWLKVRNYVPSLVFPC